MLVLHDPTEFSFQPERSETIGQISSIKGRHDAHTVCGVLMHSRLVLSPDGVPLGLAAVKCRLMDMDIGFKLNSQVVGNGKLHRTDTLLSPFRPQRSLLSALAYDLREDHPGCKVVASTIHRSQGSESRTVVVDLTTHAPGTLVAFFSDADCSKLVNVALSRAKDLLLILGSRAMLESLAAEYPFWGAFLWEYGRGISPLPGSELLDEFEPLDDIGGFPDAGRKNLPAIYSHTAR